MSISSVNKNLFPYSWELPAKKHLHYSSEKMEAPTSPVSSKLSVAVRRPDGLSASRAGLLPHGWLFFHFLEQPRAGLLSLCTADTGGLATSTGGAQQHGCAQLLTKGAAPPTRDSPRWFQTSPDVPGGQKHPHLRTTELITDSLTTSSSILCSIFTKYAHKILNSLLLLQLRSGYGSFRSAEATALE